MNDELPNPKPVSNLRQPLEQRLAHRPEVLARLHELADTLEQSVTDHSTADLAEARVSAQVRQLAREVLEQWAREANDHTQARVRHSIPKPSNTVKKTAEVADPLWLGGSPGSAMATGTARRPAATVL